MLISYLFLLVMVLLGLGFYTLLERKILSYMQVRKGPNKVGYMGFLQPFSDGVKLFAKEVKGPTSSVISLYSLAPVFGLFLSLVGWMVYFIVLDSFDMELGLLFFLVVSSLNVYVLMYSGWGSNSLYGLSGAYRGVAQVISYEVIMAMVLLCIVLHLGSYSITGLKYGSWVVGMMGLLFSMWLFVLLAEVNRSPFDFAEGESELVSGYNVEYGSIGFSLLFSGEYGSILMMSYITSVIFFPLWEELLFLMVMLSVLWIRAVLPRYRYDYLMSVCWKYMLFVVLGYFMFSGGLLVVILNEFVY